MKLLNKLQHKEISLLSFFYFFAFDVSRETYAKFTIHIKKKGPIRPSRDVPLSRYHANGLAVSRITPCEKGCLWEWLKKPDT